MHKNCAVQLPLVLVGHVTMPRMSSFVHQRRTEAFCEIYFGRRCESGEIHWWMPTWYGDSCMTW